MPENLWLRSYLLNPRELPSDFELRIVKPMTLEGKLSRSHKRID